MKKTIVIFLKYFFLWVVFFWLTNVIFLIFNFSMSKELSLEEIVKILLIGTRMDLSMAGYLTVLPGLFFSLTFFLKPKILTGILKVYTYIVLVVASFLSVLDLGLYPHWGTRVGIDAFNYAKDFKGVAANVTIPDLIKAVLLFAFYFCLFRRIFEKAIFKSTKSEFGIRWFYFPVILFVTVCLIIPIRGSFNTAPMNSSFVSFSDKHYVNQAASNYMWNFFKTVERRKTYSNPCLYFAEDEAREIFLKTENRRSVPDSSVIRIGDAGAPNVLLVILESFSNKVISKFGGEYSVCPNIDAISEEAVYFPNFYASGNRSDRGISALLGGYPSLLEVSVMRFPDKSEKLTLLSDHFNKNNYQTSFYYGGDIDFYHLKSFVLQGQYNKIVTQSEFPYETRNLSKWGVPDEYLFERALLDLQKEQSPFFKVVYTISSHPPYDVPFDKIKGSSNESKYLNSIAYTDSCLGAFISEFKKTKQWDNTLVIITSDHGYVEPGPTDINDPATYGIPLLWTGGVIKGPAVVEEIGSQPDLMPTLIHQLGWDAEKTMFGHSLFSEPSYAFYMHDSGWGYVTEKGKHFYNRETNSVKSFDGKTVGEGYLDFAKAYLQVLHDDFINK